MRNALLLAFFFHQILIFAQNDTLQGVINRYAAVTNVDPCGQWVAVTDTAGWRVQHAVLVMQMNGCSVQSNNDGSFGSISSQSPAGWWEKAVIDSISFQKIWFSKLLIHPYNAVNYRVQLVSMPVFPNAVVQTAVIAAPWNGTTGGVLAMEVQGTLTLNAPLQADTCGFRGGLAFAASNNNCNFAFSQNDYYYEAGNWRGSHKGEGIALKIPNKEMGKGALANGGGGGNDHNSGGGGGANLAAGGHGGDNDAPGIFDCDGYHPGVGGWPLNPTGGLIFMGGGGGAGHSNNGSLCSGGRGGGIMVLKVNAITGTNPTISANGGNAAVAIGDGGGGGGAGGTIWAEIAQEPVSLTISCKGGNGGSTTNLNENRCFGPGGGGGGGVLYTNSTVVQAAFSGGNPGLVTQSSNGCNGGPSFAQAGSNGSKQPLFSIQQGTVVPMPPSVDSISQLPTVCVGDNATLTCTASGAIVGYQWQVNTGAGFVDLVNNSVYAGCQSTALSITGIPSGNSGFIYRCKISSTACYGAVYSPERTLLVMEEPTAAFTASNALSTVDFTNLSTQATGYWWDFGDGQTSNAAQVSHTYALPGAYSVTLWAFNLCDTAVYQQEVQVAYLPVPAFEIPDTVSGCGAVVVMPVNTSLYADAYVWQSGGEPAGSTEAQPTFQYTVSGLYTLQLEAINGSGSQTVTHPLVVEVIPFPVADFTYSVIPPGNALQLSSSSTGADQLTWDFGDGTLLANISDPLHVYAVPGPYIITLSAQNACGASVLQQTVQLDFVATHDPSDGFVPVLFPNPSASDLTVEFTGKYDVKQGEIRILDIYGKILFEKNGLIGKKEALNLKSLPPGFYTVEIRLANSQWFLPWIKV